MDSPIHKDYHPIAQTIWEGRDETIMRDTSNCLGEGRAYSKQGRTLTELTQGWVFFHISSVSYWHGRTGCREYSPFRGRCRQHALLGTRNHAFGS